MLNRSPSSRSEIIQTLEKRFGPSMAGSSFRMVSAHASSLGRFFREGSLELDEATSRELVRELRLDEVVQ